MKAKLFKQILEDLLDHNGFATDLIDMKDLERDSKKAGFDEVMYVAGKDDTEVFVINILKIK